MVRYVIEVMSEIREMERIVIVGPKKELLFLEKNYEKVSVVDQEGSMVKNLLSGISFLEAKGPVLVSTSDIPFLTSEAVTRFLEECRPFEFDFYYPLIPKSYFNDVPKTFVKLKEGKFAGGNMVLLRAEKMKRLSELSEKITESRKNPFKILSLLGARLPFLYLTRKLSLNDIVNKAEDHGVKGRAMILPYPEVAFDIDNKEDLLFFFPSKGRNH